MRIRADQVRVGDKLNISTSLVPRDDMPTVIEIRKTRPTKPRPFAKARTVLIVLDTPDARPGRGPNEMLHLPEDMLIVVTR